MIRSFRSNDTIGNTLSAGIIRKYYAFFQSEVRPRAILGKTRAVTLGWPGSEGRANWEVAKKL